MDLRERYSIAAGLARSYPLTSFPIELSMNQKRIQDAMRAGARFPDEIAAESGLSLASVLEEIKPPSAFLMPEEGELSLSLDSWI